ncbi:MAG TPA: hypothetical protein H9782_04505 [Candidatus Bariatricus faecipullorum]|nr:hypothetical protein [Candidatus Bariatricus faecipullorum]
MSKAAAKPPESTECGAVICRTAKFQLKELIYNPGLRYTIDSMMQTGFLSANFRKREG